MPTAGARSAASRITLTRALVALGAVLVAINIASAIWDARADRDRTELRARRNLSNLGGLLSEQTAAALETVDLVLRDAVRDGTPAKVAAMTPRLRDEMRSEEHTSELQSLAYLVCRLLLEKKKNAAS